MGVPAQIAHTHSRASGKRAGIEGTRSLIEIDSSTLSRTPKGTELATRFTEHLLTKAIAHDLKTFMHSSFCAAPRATRSLKVDMLVVRARGNYRHNESSNSKYDTACKQPWYRILVLIF